MNKSIKILIAITTLLSITACNTQIKNATTETVKIYGNCGMCEKTIEKAAFQKGIANADWNKDSKMATITFDATKTNQDEILKRIALSGYDNDKFLAPNEVYAKLPECCQYERKSQTVAIAETKIDIDNTKKEIPEHKAAVQDTKKEIPEHKAAVQDTKKEIPEHKATADITKIEKKEDHAAHNHAVVTETKQDVPQLKAVFDNYFAVKDALVKTDGNIASTKAKELLAAINAVKMEKLSTEEHSVWMKVNKDLILDVQSMAKTQDPNQQREHLDMLSKNMYALIKVAKTETPTYYQFCPMANDGKGANWLSKENDVKNPYYGSQMLTCGKVVETIK